MVHSKINTLICPSRAVTSSLTWGQRIRFVTCQLLKRQVTVWTQFFLFLFWLEKGTQFQTAFVKQHTTQELNLLCISRTILGQKNTVTEHSIWFWKELCWTFCVVVYMRVCIYVKSTARCNFLTFKRYIHSQWLRWCIFHKIWPGIELIYDINSHNYRATVNTKM